MSNKCIYQPTGAAREYARWACNLYNGCPHGCTYCYCKRGVLANVLGKDIPTLKKQVGKNAREALETFEREIIKYKDKIKEQGEYLFFSFSTDPLCDKEECLTFLCVLICVYIGVPVQLLTKAVNWLYHIDWQNLLERSKGLVRIGTTLTGCDDQEPGAPGNMARIRMLLGARQFSKTKPFVSIEPIISFSKSLAMIKRVSDKLGHDVEFRIGLMSGVKKESYYDKWDCAAFMNSVLELQQRTGFDVVWKHSIRDYYSKHFPNQKQI